MVSHSRAHALVQAGAVAAGLPLVSTGATNVVFRPFGLDGFTSRFATHRRSVSTDLSTDLSGWEPVASALGELRGSSRQLEDFLLTELDQLASLCADLVRQKDEIDRQRRMLDEQQSQIEALRTTDERNTAQIAAAVEAERTQLKTARIEFDQNRRVVEEQQQALASSLEQQRAQFDAQRAAWLEEQEHARQQAARLAETATRLAEAEAEIQAEQAELVRQRELSGRNQSELESHLRQQLEELETSLANYRAEVEPLRIDSQRASELEAELEQLRAAAETVQQAAVAAHHQEVSQLQSQLQAVHQERDELLAQADAARQVDTQQSVDAERANLAESALQDAHREISQLRTQLQSLEQQVAQGVSADVEQRLREMQHERDQLASELDTARTQSNRLAGMAVELADARAQLADARADILRAREQSSAQRSENENLLHQQIIELERERMSLELELETVRNRTAELLENASEEKRRMAEERAQWAGELRQMRRAFESKPTLEPPPPPAVPVPRTAQPAAELPPASDPVLDSVMAQFEQLQRERTQRRANSHVA